MRKNTAFLLTKVCIAAVLDLPASFLGNKYGPPPPAGEESYSCHISTQRTVGWLLAVVFAMCSSATFWPRYRQCEATQQLVFVRKVLQCQFVSLMCVGFNLPLSL